MCRLNDSTRQKNKNNIVSGRILKKKVIRKKENTMSTPTLNLVCDVDTLRTLIKKKNTVRVVDVRKKEDYSKGHIPTSVSLPLANLLSNDSPESIISVLNNLGIANNTPVVVYDDTFGALASRVAWSFKFVGHENVSLLGVTYSGWNP
jgi:thiosulfate/3-mercaptopyruvate sulfurtransferase